MMDKTAVLHLEAQVQCLTGQDFGGIIGNLNTMLTSLPI